MDFSIIIPTLNEEKLLPKLLNQIADKKIREKFYYEIIISDGGSSDNTIQIAEKYADKIIKYEKESPQTIAAGRNAGAEKAEGKILIFINSDVIFENFSRFLSIIENEISEDFCALLPQVQIHPSERKFTDLIFLGFYNRYFNFLNLIGLGMGRGECQVIKKDVFDKIGGNNVSLPAGEDFDLFMKIRRIGKIKYLKELVVYESPRRFRKYGHIFVFFTWFLNSVYIILFKKSFTQQWRAVR